MNYLDKRIQVICNELKKLSIKERFPLTQWQYREGKFLRPEEAEAGTGAGGQSGSEEAEAGGAGFQPFDTRTMHWYGKDRHYWFRSEWEVPGALAWREVWLQVDTQANGWDARNPQFLLFVNGEPVQGLDTNHREVRLTTAAQAGEHYRLDLQAWSGTDVEELQFRAAVLEYDAAIGRLYYDLQVPLRAFSRLPADGRARCELLEALNETVNLLDLREPYSGEFYAALAKAQDFISLRIYEELAGSDEVIASCIGHTHIDVAWQWTVEQSREKVARSFSTVLKLMDEYPNYRFMSSQAVLYVFLKERYPELYARVKERVREGRWEVEGGMWVEPDCNLTSGESLVRQFLYGKRFFREEFGVDNRILWLPDVFGYSGALPQIMKKSGVDYFMTTKLNWNQVNQMPHDTFMWRGIDGSEVLTHLITTVSPGQPLTDFNTTYNGELHPDALIGAWERYQDKALNNDVLVSYGYGDGGGGPTREHLETSLRMEVGLPGMPKVRQVFAGQYFDELASRLRSDRGNKRLGELNQHFSEPNRRLRGSNQRLATWVGELYFEYHRGTYTSMARNKRVNRKAEFALMDVEFLEVLCGGGAVGSVVDGVVDGGVDDVGGEGSSHKAGYKTEYKEAMDALWKTVLTNQFHDILPGTCIEEVYEVTQKEYTEVQKQTSAMISERLDKLHGDKVESDGNDEAERDQSKNNNKNSRNNEILVVNTTGFPRNDVLVLESCDAFALATADGQVWPVQQTAEGEAVVWLENLPAKGYQSFRLLDQAGLIEAEDQSVSKHEADDKKSPFTFAGERELETPYYEVGWGGFGQINRLYDKANQREVLLAGRAGNLFCMYEDKPMHYDNWDIDHYYTEKSWMVDDCRRFEWTERGPVRATLRIEWVIARSTIVQNIHFYAASMRIDFETTVDWHEHQHLLKVHFPLNVHTDEATFDIQFGNVTRKTHCNTSWDEARFESGGHKWVDVSEGHYGVSLLNDCKYGHSVEGIGAGSDWGADVGSGVCSGVGADVGLTLIKSGIWPNPAADQEVHTFAYALFPHAGTWRDAGTVAEGYFFNQPLLVAGVGVGVGAEAVAVGAAGELVVGAADRAAKVVGAALAEEVEGAAEISAVDRFSLAWVDAPNVVIETIKPAEDGDGVIVRLYEVDNALTTTRLHWGRALESVCECNLLEETLDIDSASVEVDVEVNGDGASASAGGGVATSAGGEMTYEITITLKPYEIKTYRLR